MPPFLIPQPDGGSDAARTNKIDPDYPNDPTPPGPNPDPCADDRGDGNEGRPLWGKAVKIGKKMVKAANRGEDLLDAKTWKKMLDSEWADAAEAGLDVQAALNGDMVALLSVLDYAAQQVVGVGFFDMLDTLKLGKYLGQSWYDDATSKLTSSKYFGKFANSIDDVGTLENVAGLSLRKYDKHDNPIYEIPSGSAHRIFDNFADAWNRTPRTLPNGKLQIRNGSDVITFGKATDSGDWTFYLNRDGNLSKVRFNNY